MEQTKFRDWNFINVLKFQACIVGEFESFGMASVNVWKWKLSKSLQASVSLNQNHTESFFSGCSLIKFVNENKKTLWKFFITLQLFQGS